MGIFDFWRRRRRRRRTGDTAEPTRAASDDDADQPTRLCFVLCRSERPEDLTRAGAVVARVFGDGHTAEAGGDNLVTVCRGDETVGFLAHVPAPIPGGEAESSASQNFLWPDGESAVAAHRSHVIVTTIGPPELTPVRSALAVSRLALVALDLFDGLGVYWGNASVCNERELFERFCDDLSEENLPVPMWLRFQPVRMDDGRFALYTLGMRQFGLMELEVDRCDLSARELFEFVANLANYLIQHGPVIKDGDTAGESNEQRIVVRHRPSMIDEARQVYKFVFVG